MENGHQKRLNQDFATMGPWSTNILWEVREDQEKYLKEAWYWNFTNVWGVWGWQNVNIITEEIGLKGKKRISIFSKNMTLHEKQIIRGWWLIKDSSYEGTFLHGTERDCVII